jgi:hypothetical protein
MQFDFYKLEIFIPETHFKPLQKALQDVDAGHIGNYDSCLSYSKVTGVWRTLENASPFVGEVNEFSEEPELKVEVIVKSQNLEKTIAAIKAVHPYEEPVINILPMLVL